MPEINEALLREVVEDMRLNPETADQKSWAKQGGGCLTSMCIAGRTCHLSGMTFIWKDSLGTLDMQGASNVTEGFIPNVARSLLGLDYETGESIFNVTGFCVECGVSVLMGGGHYESGHDVRDVTVEEMVRVIAEATGLEFKPPVTIEGENS